MVTRFEEADITIFRLNCSPIRLRAALAAVAILIVAACVGGSDDEKSTTVPFTNVSTIAGNGERGYRDGPLSQALFESPEGIAVAQDGTIYVAETSAGRIRKIDSTGEVTTLLSGDQVKLPHRLATSIEGILYVSDAANNRILGVNPDGGVVVLAGSEEAGDVNGPADEALFRFPIGLGVRADGALIVVDTGNSKIRAILASNEVVTIAGSGQRGYVDGPGSEAQFSGLNELAINGRGEIYVTEPANAAIRKVRPDGVVSTIAGGGEHTISGDDAVFMGPAGIVAIADQNVYVADFGRHQILQVDIAGTVATLAGDGEPGLVDGPGSNARFNRPTGMAVGPGGALYIADAGNHAIRKIDFAQTDATN